jgi:hypothetical protein
MNHASVRRIIMPYTDVSFSPLLYTGLDEHVALFALVYREHIWLKKTCFQCHKAYSKHTMGHC